MWTNDELSSLSAAPSGSPSPSRVEAAQACLARGDAPCARRILEGRARGQRERSMLINVYRMEGRSSQQLGAMESFVRDYPESRHSRRYRATLSRHGR